jgi:ketosteroid isomerase-like protein
MTQEDVEIVRRSWEALNRGDLDAFIDCFDPDIEWHDLPNYPGAGSHWGRRAFRRHVEGFVDAWGKVSVEIEEIVQSGDCVVARIRYIGTGKESGASVETPPSGAIYEVREGRILRVRQFAEHQQALEAAGLRE